MSRLLTSRLRKLELDAGQVVGNSQDWHIMHVILNPDRSTQGTLETIIMGGVVVRDDSGWMKTVERADG